MASLSSCVFSLSPPANAGELSISQSISPTEEMENHSSPATLSQDLLLQWVSVLVRLESPGGAMSCQLSRQERGSWGWSRWPTSRTRQGKGRAGPLHGMAGSRLCWWTSSLMMFCANSILQFTSSGSGFTNWDVVTGCANARRMGLLWSTGHRKRSY